MFGFDYAKWSVIGGGEMGVCFKSGGVFLVCNLSSD